MRAKTLALLVGSATALNNGVGKLPAMGYDSAFYVLTQDHVLIVV